MPSEPTAVSSRRTLPLALVVAVLLAAIAVGAYYVAVKGPKRSALVRWRPQIAAMLQGEDAYTQFGFPTPPIMALVLYPFVAVELPVQVGMSAWLLLKVILTLVALHWLLKQQRDAWQFRPPDAVPVFALLASATPIVADLMHGNINLWILFLVVAAWRAFATGRKALAGVVLGLAVACKATPVLLVLYFAWKREWTTTTAAVIGLAVWLFIAPAAYFGWERNLYLLDRWSGLMLKPYLSEGRAERDVRNQSLAGLYQRLTAPPRTERPVDAEDEPLHTDPPINIASLDPTTSRWLWRVLAGAAVAGLWWLTRFPAASTDRRWLEHEFAIVLLAMLLLSERSWKHHYVTVLPSFVALISWMAQRREPAARPVVVALTAVAALLPIVASQDLLGTLAGALIVDRLQTYGVYIWSAALLIAAHLIARRDLDG